MASFTLKKLGCSALPREVRKGEFMPVPINNSRPSLPYAPTQSLPNNARFDILTTTQRPPTAEMLDAEFNALTDDVNMLAVAINDVQAGSIPGSDDPNNANKLLKTDGAGNLSWTLVTNAELAPSAVVEQALALQSVTTAKIGDAAVTNAKLSLGAVTTDKIDINAVTSEEIAPNAVITAKLSDNAVTTPKIIDGAVTTPKLALKAVTQAQIADLAVGTPQLIDANVTTTKIANNAVTAAKLSSSGAAVGTVATSGAGSSVSWSAIPTTGKILQIQNYFTSSKAIANGASRVAVSFVDPFLVQITPLSNTSSIFIFINANVATGDDRGGGIILFFLKNGIEFTGKDAPFFNTYTGDQDASKLLNCSALYVDKNNSLNQITYEIQAAAYLYPPIVLNQASKPITINNISSSSITAVEVQI